MKLDNIDILDNGRKLPLVEDFYTIQGEGRHTGKPAYFIRLGGCDVGCSWCDAKMTWNPKLYPPVEVDLIVQNRKYLVFVEVKLRKSDQFAQAREYVDLKKQDRLRVTASVYLSENPTNLQPRFDVVEIYAPEGTMTVSPEINHLEDAFQ